MDEFSLIELLTTTIGAKSGALEGVGDDAAILPVPRDRHLVVSTDTLNEGVHFSVGAEPSDVGFKALAVSLSDLASMGAQPAWFLLALTLPSMTPGWVGKFAEGMGEAARDGEISLVGGDVTSGPLSITVTACGLVRPGLALLRSGANEGDILAISGPTGLAARALADQRRGIKPADACLAALQRPRPRNRFGQALVGVASSCIDISDGLLADATHVARSSGVGMRLELDCLPIPAQLRDMENAERWEMQLGGGDDYELCFTVPPDKWTEAEEAASDTGVSVIRIGQVVAGSECVCIAPDGARFRPARSGYVHGVSS